MKSFYPTTLFLTTVLAQNSVDIGPSPTASTGCEAHGDHWDCEASRNSAAAVAPTSSAILENDHVDHAVGTGTLPPSPTESYGCMAHGDHWDCAGPTTTTFGSSLDTETIDIASITEVKGCHAQGESQLCMAGSSVFEVISPVYSITAPDQYSECHADGDTL